MMILGEVFMRHYFSIYRRGKAPHVGKAFSLLSPSNSTISIYNSTCF